MPRTNHIFPADANLFQNFGAMTKKSHFPDCHWPDFKMQDTKSTTSEEESSGWIAAFGEKRGASIYFLHTLQSFMFHLWLFLLFLNRKPHTI